MRATEQAAAEIIEEFSFFDDWADKYEQLIDQGRQLPPLPDKYRVDGCKLSGCQSTVWFAAEQQADGQLRYFADSWPKLVSTSICQPPAATGWPAWSAPFAPRPILHRMAKPITAAGAR
jgi:sulfur transfer protein SufE